MKFDDRNLGQENSEDTVTSLSNFLSPLSCQVLVSDHFKAPKVGSPATKGYYVAAVKGGVDLVQRTIVPAPPRPALLPNCSTPHKAVVSNS